MVVTYDKVKVQR